jgi:hypothetical protein
MGNAFWRASVSALVVLVAPSPAWAQTPSELAAAQTWFSEGLAFEAAGNWKDALDRFRRVGQIKHTPQVDFHLGLCESHSGELVEALVDLGRALESAKAQHVPNVESAAASELPGLRARVPTIQIVLPAGQRAERVLLDDRAIAAVSINERIPVNPGPHTVVVEFASGPVSQKVAVEERDHLVVRAEAPPSSGNAAPKPEKGGEPPPPPPPTEGQKGPSVLGWVLVGVGGAALVGGVVFWAMRSNEISTLDGLCGDGRQHCPESARSDYDAGKTYATVSVGLLGAGVVLAAAGAIVLVSSKGSGAERVSVAPAAYPGGAGGLVRATF